MTSEAEAGETRAGRILGMRGAPGAGRGRKDPPPEPPGRAGSCPHLESGLRPPEPGENL